MSSPSSQKAKYEPTDAQVFRAMICHEDDLIDQRIQWLATIEGLLFAALGLAWKERAPGLCIAVSLLGILVALSSFLALYFSGKAIFQLQNDWADGRPEGYTGPPVIGLRASQKLTHLLPWFCLPPLFIAGWISVILIRVKNW